MSPQKSQNNKRTYRNIITETVIDDIDQIDQKNYINQLKRRIATKQYPFKFKIILTSEFNTPIAFDIIEAHYSHPVQIIQTENNLTAFYDDLLDKFNAWIDGFQERGSGFVFKKIISVNVKQHKYNSQRASSYIPLQFKSSNIINVQNTKDNKCFLWSILAKLYPANRDKQRVSKYKPYEDKINMNGIDYPVKIKDIPKVEKQNGNLSINVFALENQTNKQSLYPVYVSNVESENIIDLLFIENNENTHYCLIKDLESFKYDKNKHKSFTCRNCMQGFQRKVTLERHQEICLDHKHCNTIMPKKGKNSLKFKNHHFREKLPFSIYCDFEANNIPIETTQPNPNESYTKKIFKQEINSYGIYVKSNYSNIFKSQYFEYVGNDSKEKFVKKIISIYKNITYNMYLNEKQGPVLSKEQEQEFQEATHCYICKNEFTDLIREHNHFTGGYRGAACQSCNTKEGKSSKLIPVFFHNGSNYDFHFIIEELKKYEDEYNKVTTLSKSSEDYISIEYGSNYQKLRFLDSYRFLSKGLSDVAKSLKEFPILESEFEETSLLKQKGFYPYEYIDSIERFKENKLPDISKFYSTLKQEGISEEEYKHAQNVWNTYNCKTLKDYHNLYLKTDVLLLADAFEQFRDFFLRHHQIDPCYCFSAPGLTWQCGLKYTGIELELLTDYDMLQMFEKGIRGGFSGVLGSRYVKAYNKYTPNYKDGNRLLDDNELKECLKKLKNGENINDLLKEKYLLYLDANNLYGWAMSQKLPTRDFKWEYNPDVQHNNKPNYYKNIPENRGCIIECDLEYPDSCKFKTKNYPLAPEHMIVKEEMLSPYQLNLLEEQETKLGKEKKLFLTLYDKKKYIVHHSILKEYIKLGLKVTKVYRIISFEESNWLKKYIDFNTNQRTKAKSDFEKDLWKLMNNAFYGKTMENIRNRCDIKLLNNENEIKKFMNKPNFKDSVIFNDNLVAIVNNITSIKFNKPIYLGQAILDYSKQLMYRFYYEVINEVWSDNEIIGFDTDSYFLSIKTKDIYKDLKQVQDELDTSDYPKDHPLYSVDNKKVIGKFKDELNGKIMNEIIFLKSKAYAYTLSDLTEKKKLKGISQPIVKKEMNFKNYKNCLYNTETQLNTMFRLNSEKHNMFINEVKKVSLNPFDDKRYICEDGINTLPYGIESLYFI